MPGRRIHHADRSCDTGRAASASCCFGGELFFTTTELFTLEEVSLLETGEESLLVEGEVSLLVEGEESLLETGEESLLETGEVSFLTTVT